MENVVLCDCCKENLLKDSNGLVVIVDKYDAIIKEYIPQTICLSCKGECDKKLKEKYKSSGFNTSLSYEISDLKNPTLFGERLFEYMNILLMGKVSNETQKNMIALFNNMLPFVVRESTDEEQQLVQMQHS